MTSAERTLSPELLQRASLRGDEYAWPIDDIPLVIEDARRAGLVNIGGQLQFRLPDATCECHWIEVDASKSAPEGLPRQERVEQTASAALAQFTRLRAEVDFLAEGRRVFAGEFGEVERRGEDARNFMCFVWYVSSRADEEG